MNKADDSHGSANVNQDYAQSLRSSRIMEKVQNTSFKLIHADSIYAGSE
jgi:hypothetical protein